MEYFKKCLTDAFENNRYDINILENLCKMFKKWEQTPTTEDDRQDSIFLPYIRGTTEKISTMLRKFYIKTVFQDHSTLVHFLQLTCNPSYDRRDLQNPV